MGNKKNLKESLYVVFLRFARTKYLKFMRSIFVARRMKQCIKNKSVSIVSQNCLGGIISHDCGIRFNSPTINMWMPVPEFLEYVKKIEIYKNCDLKDVSAQSDYPIGLLGDKIHIHFIHYRNFEDAYNKWMARSQRIDLSNIRVVMVENDGCRPEDLVEFDALPYKKVVFTAKEYPQIQSSFFLREFQKEGVVSFAMRWKGLFGKRVCDLFNWVDFLN